MKVGFFSESSADQAALAILTEGILGERPEPPNMALDGHGVMSVLGELDGVFRGIHFHSDAEALIVVVDSDDTDPHSAAHDAPGADLSNCRLCQLRQIVERARKQLRPRHGRPPLKFAIGLAVPTIEAWYLVGKNHQVGEAPWIAGCSSNKRPFTRPQLKIEVYGTERPSLELETKHAVEGSSRILPRLNPRFPWASD